MSVVVHVALHFRTVLSPVVWIWMPLRTQVGLCLEDAIVIADEAHHLESTARECISASLSKTLFLDLGQ